MVRFSFATTLALAATTTHAFTSMPGRTALVGVQHQQQQQLLVSTVAPPARYHASSSTVLHMNLFDRFQRVAKSNLNNILKNLEDPEKIMEQALEDMQVRVV